MKKKVIYALLTISLSAMLAACGHEHTWVEATCTQPKHCSECAETEGEVLEHTWVEATCTTAKTCSECGGTEGETLAHTLKDANYQQPAICEVCGVTEGEKLQADFEKYGFECNIKWDVPYTYITKNFEGYDSIGTITFSDYEIISSNEKLEGIDGYEWRVFNATMVWNDADAENINCSRFDFWSVFGDYYNIKGYADSYNSETLVSTVNYNGINYTECKEYREELYDSWQNNGFKMIYKYAVRVPIGYDGLVFVVVDNKSLEISETMEDEYINDLVNENTAFLRIN